jgi:DNA-binding NarL/FixJ family response regulator
MEREHLSGREIEVLDHIAMGATNKAAAEALGISRRTIETHRSHILKKLGAKNAVELVRMVLRGGGGDPNPPTANARTARPSFQTGDHHPG